MRITAKIKALLMLLRIHNVVLSYIAVLIGALAITKYAGLDIETLDLVKTSLIVGIPVLLVSAAGYVVNDYFDIEVDRINKPYRPLPSGMISPETAFNLALTLFVMGIASSIWLKWPVVLFTGINAILIYAYSYKIKKLGLPGNIVIAFCSSNTILYGALAWCLIYNLDLKYLLVIIPPYVISFILVIAREFVKGVEDYVGDRSLGIRTLPVVMGIRKSLLVIVAVVIAMICISWLPLMLGASLIYGILALVVDAMALHSSIILIKAKSDEDAIKVAMKARRELKISFGIGILAFLLGYLV